MNTRILFVDQLTETEFIVEPKAKKYTWINPAGASLSYLVPESGDILIVRSFILDEERGRIKLFTVYVYDAPIVIKDWCPECDTNTENKFNSLRELYDNKLTTCAHCKKPLLLCSVCRSCNINCEDGNLMIFDIDLFEFTDNPPKTLGFGRGGI